MSRSPYSVVRSSLLRTTCPRCDKACFQHAVYTRVLHDVGDLVAGRPRDIHLTYSRHRCTRCNKFFNADMSNCALPKAITPIASLPCPSDSSWRTACPIEPPADTCGGIIGFLSPTPPSKTGWRPGGK